MDELDYEQIVALYHEDLYRFAYSLARNPDDASELTQEAYCRLLSKGASLRDPSRVKPWLFTIIYRIFVTEKRHAGRFPHLSLAAVEHELPVLSGNTVDRMDAATVLDALLEIDEHHRAPLVLFYLQDLSYREIAELLDVPVGTVMSRLSRAKAALRERVVNRRAEAGDGDVIPLNPLPQSKAK